ncbi:MAG: endonuclease [Candidatus Acidiferrales bacterium]
MRRKKSYDQIIERIFHSKHKAGVTQIDFARDEIVLACQRLGVPPPKNLGDLIYSYRHRAILPPSIRETAPKGQAWVIRGTGRAKYRFALITDRPLVPSVNLAATKVPDATPGIVAMYAQDDEQALLARLRYNRLLDIFTGVTCYSLQSHLRTTAPQLGQIEIDELYVGIDKKGVHYVFPVQAKGSKDRLSIIQIEQDIAACRTKFRNLVCRPIGAQFARDDVIALFEFETDGPEVAIASEKHYKLVPHEEVSEADLETYRSRKAE